MVLGLIAAVAPLLAGTADAQVRASPTRMVTAADPQSIVQALQGAGYKAKLERDDAGDPRIESGASGARWYVNFYGCEKGAQCTTVTFSAGWSDADVTMARINEWNRDKRFSRAYLDKEDDPILEFDVDLDKGGVSGDLFIDNVEFWEASLGAFRSYIG